jgi:PAS domain S-box-containing protein
MKGLRLTAKLALFVLALGLVEGGLMAALLWAGGVRHPAFLGLAGGVGAFLTGLVGLFVVRQVARPLARLTAAARRVGQGDLQAPIDIRTRDELGEVADAFRDMQSRLRQIYEDLERLVAERTARLEETSRFLAAVLDSSTEYAIVATDAQWTVQVFNEGARRTFGYEAAEMAGQPLARLIPPEEIEAALGVEMIQTLQAHGRHEGEGTRLRRGGQRFPVRTVTTVRRDDQGRTIGYTVLLRDVTQQKALEERLRQYTDHLEEMVAAKTAQLQEVNVELARAGQLKSQFLTTMSHELRTPLNAIIGFAEAIRDGLAGQAAPEQREFAEDINQAGRQLLAMINDILDLAKLEAGALELDLQPCDLGGIVDEVFRVVRGYARRRGVGLVADIEPRPLELTADPLKLKQVLFNLLSNAVKFSAAGAAVHVTGRLHAETVTLRVADAGVGIAPEDLAYIFEDFRQADASLSRRHEGTGLGLALVRRLVELHGGDVAVESELGKGTTFTVTLLRDLVPGRAPT